MSSPEDTQPQHACACKEPARAFKEGNDQRTILQAFLESPEWPPQAQQLFDASDAGLLETVVSDQLMDLPVYLSLKDKLALSRLHVASRV